MKLKITLFLILLSPLFAQAEYGNIRINEIHSVYDGDTFRATIDGWPPLLGKNIGIRVNGIDTPEIRGKCQQEKDLAIQARELAKSVLYSARVIELRNMDRGKYFRIIADIYADGENLTDRIIGSGLGVAYDGGTKIKDWCE